MKNKKFLFVFVILVAFLARVKFVGLGLPYFQNEDEMHHFNRTIQMVQSGSFNPKYFLKPSLHFYLRIPVTAIAFIWNVKKSRIQKLSDIKITNKYGLSNYSSTASHPGIVKFNRAFSLLLSLLTLILIFHILNELTNSYFTCIIGTSLFALAPPQIELSTQINVDVPVMFFCTLASFLALKTYNNFSLNNLILLTFISGFAISTKYNAAPIYFLPFFTTLLCKKLNSKTIFISLFFPLLAFFIASPYAFINYNLFLDHLAYEVKHYGIDGHVGHIQKPGIMQLFFYIKWFCLYAIGIVPFLCCLFGVYRSLACNTSKSNINKILITLFFPTLFILLMIFQKANFTRNMLMALPFLCIFASIGLTHFLYIITKNLSDKNFNRIFIRNATIFFIILFLAQAFTQTLMLEKKVFKLRDTRKFVSSWVRKHSNFNHNIFTSGKLELEHDIYNHVNVARINEDIPFFHLYNQGANFLVLPKYIKDNERSLYQKLISFKGQSKDPQNRLVINPSIVIYKQAPITSLKTQKIKNIASLTQSNINIIKDDNSLKLSCDRVSNKDCWLTSKINKVSLNNFETNNKKLKISYTTSWEKQKVMILVNDKLEDISCSNLKTWEICQKEILLPKEKVKDNYVYIIVKKLISPKLAKISSDQRLLGIMIK